MNPAVLERFQLPGPLRDHAAIAKGTDDERATLINSVMMRVVARGYAFRSSLRERERHAFDLEDILQEVWLELLLKAHYYRDDRAKYITFAMRLVENKLGEIRNKWHTVPGPKDTAARLKAPGDTGTAEKVRQTVRETSSLAAEPQDLLDEDRPDEIALAEERRQQTIGVLRAALERMGRRNRVRRLVIQLIYGIGRQDAMEVGQVADLCCMTVAQVIVIKADAERELGQLASAIAEEAHLDLTVA